ncbi:MAG: glycosyltransferase, partial [Verrucomicrobiota bacterium]
LSDADVFVWPGVGEGVGMVYLEAQAAGLPIVAEAHPAPEELVAEPCVPEDDPKAFAEAIMRVVLPGNLNKASVRAREHVETRHSLHSAAARLHEALTPLVT